MFRTWRGGVDEIMPPRAEIACEVDILDQYR
jgi:hypothetical protein